MEAARKCLQSEGLEETDENIFIVATCEDRGVAFLKNEAELGIRLKTKEPTASTAESSAAENGPVAYRIRVNDRDYTMTIDGKTAVVNGKTYRIGDIRPHETGQAVPANNDGASGDTSVIAPFPGKIIDVVAHVGDTVKAGDSILVLESMKMETHVSAPVDGAIRHIAVAQGALVTKSQILATIDPGAQPD